MDEHAFTPELTDADADADRLDRTLTDLFAAARPVPGWEDRAVAKLRAGRRRTFSLPAVTRRLAVAAAVLLALGTVGAVAKSLADGGLRLPGGETVAARIGKESPAVSPSTSPFIAGVVVMDEIADTHAKTLFDVTGHVDVNGLQPPDLALDTMRLKTALEVEQVQQRARYRGMNAAVATDPSGVSVHSNGGYLAADKLKLPTLNGTAPNVTYSALAPQGGNFQGGGGIGGGIGGMPTAGYFNPATVRPAFQQPTAGGPRPNNGVGAPIFSFYVAPFGEDGTTPTTTAKQNPAQKPKPADAPNQPPPQAGPTKRVVIRSGDIEFEVESFDSAHATITRLVTAIAGALVGNVNSEKLANGKVKGSITVRVPPEHLDGLILDLRRELGKGGELKGVRVASQDVTKQYTDLESRLKAARMMEQRLLQMIKDGKGEIKQLLEAERELGVWRTKIEEAEGELRYYANLAALSTLTISVTEKEIRAAAGLTENERVQAGVEVEDVDKAYQQLAAAVVEAKGRITKSELKQLAAGQFNAALHFEVPPDAGGPLRDRLRQLGRVARLEIDRVQQADGGTVAKDARVKRGDTVFLVQLYNLAAVAPRETAAVQVAVMDVPAAYTALRDVAAKVAAKVLAAQLNEQDPRNVTALLNFEIKRADDAAIRAALDAAGEVVSRQVTRAAEGDAVTDTKVLYQTTFLPASGLRPREVTVLAVEVPDVEQAAAVVAAQAAEAKGRQVIGQTTRDRTGKATAKLVYEVPLLAAAGIVERIKAAGTVRLAESVRDPKSSDGRYATARLDVTLSAPDKIVDDGGLWPPVRRGLSYSASVLLTSVTWVVFGLCVVLPWAVVGYFGYRLVRRATRTAPAA